MRRQTISLAEALHPALESARPMVEAKRHRLSVTGDAERAWVRADKVRLAHALANLLSNATRYTPPRGTHRGGGP